MLALPDSRCFSETLAFSVALLSSLCPWLLERQQQALSHRHQRQERRAWTWVMLPQLSWASQALPESLVMQQDWMQLLMAKQQQRRQSPSCASWRPPQRPARRAAAPARRGR
jgi:hypothetical protein